MIVGASLRARQKSNIFTKNSRTAKRAMQNEIICMASAWPSARQLVNAGSKGRNAEDVTSRQPRSAGTNSFHSATSTYPTGIEPILVTSRAWLAKMHSHPLRVFHIVASAADGSRPASKPSLMKRLPALIEVRTCCRVEIDWRSRDDFGCDTARLDALDVVRRLLVTWGNREGLGHFPMPRLPQVAMAERCRR